MVKFTTHSASAVVSGQPIVLVNRIGIAMQDIAANEIGSSTSKKALFKLTRLALKAWAQFAIADATRKASEDSLLKDTVAAFKARAQLATDALGGRATRL